MIRGDTQAEYQAYADKLAETFATEGWKLLVEEAKSQVLQNQRSAIEATSWEEVLRLQGETTQLIRLVMLEDTIDMIGATIDENEKDE